MSMVWIIIPSLKARVASGIVPTLVREHFISSKKENHWQYLVILELFTQY